MLASSPLPDSPSSLYPIYTNTPTPYQLSVTPHPLTYESPVTYNHKSGSSMDPSAVDFRSFYPYTPNEVKHRKRTTSTQLKTLENVFRRDTKPNGPLRVELATKLGMTARGVQVWFQNRRAKEKNKTSKASKVTTDVHETDIPNQDTPASPEDAEYSAASPEVRHSPPDVEDSSSPSSSPESTSPPALHVITNSVPPAWQGPRSDNLLRDHSHRFDLDLHASRRGSLPANAFVHTEHPTNSPQGDPSEPFARRLSVDASLQRLANNPYAHLARAKNTALFGTRGMAPVRRPSSRVPFTPYLQRASSHNGSTNYRLDVRRASADPRSFRSHPRGPSPSSLSHYHGIRTSLPEHSLYTVTSRTLPSPIPGPLPSPNFSFGAASTPSMASSSGSSDRNSPVSFPFRGEEFDEEDLTSYGPVSRFGSIASVATSDSSINSAYYPDVNSCVREHDPSFDHSARRDSCASGNFLTLMSGLDVNGMPEDHGSFVPHKDTNPGIIKANQNEAPMEFTPYSSHPSPTSTISPDQSTSPSTLPISRSSELAFALQSPEDQIKRVDEQATYTGHPMTPPEVNQPQQQYYNIHEVVNINAQSATAASLDYADNHHYNPAPVTSHEQLYEGYSADSRNNHALHMAFDYHAPVSNVYSTYGGAVDPSMVSPLENRVQNVETFVPYA